MPRPKTAKTLQQELDGIATSLAMAIEERDKAKAAYENLKLDRNGMFESLKQANEERDKLRNHAAQTETELNAAKHEIANLQRLNAIQLGYIQRANEDERMTNCNGFDIRKGPQLDTAGNERYSRPMTIR